jgi:hypothetical protein
MRGKFSLKRVVLVTVGVLACLELITYALFGAPQKALTLLEASQGAERTSARWMCIESDTWHKMTRRQQKAVEACLRERGMVLYTDRDDIPEENVIWGEYDGERRWIGYSGGSSNSWGIKFQMPCCFYAHFGNVTGDLGAYGSEGLFIWVGCSRYGPDRR